MTYYTILLEPTAETGYSQATVHSIWKSKNMAEEFAELHRSAYPEWRVTVEEKALCDESDLALLKSEMEDEDNNPITDD